MNVRLSILHGEAMDYAAEQYGPQRKGEKVWWPHVFEQKFAELIIQDICDILEPSEEHRKDASWGYLGGEEGVQLLDSSIQQIKDYFEIKNNLQA